jgi:hypothetical protein
MQELVVCVGHPIVTVRDIHAEVVTRVASSLETGGLPRYPKSKINVMKPVQSFVALYFQQIMKTLGLKLYTKCLHVLFV